MTFQIELCKDWMRRETAELLKIKLNKEIEIEAVNERLGFLEKCRAEINEANRILRGLNPPR